MKKIILSVCIILSALGVNAQTFITPNNGDVGETLTVFISGNSQSDFEAWSSTPAYLFLGKDDYYMDSYNLIEVPNNSQSNWQWNSSVFSYGFYTTISISYDINTVGNFYLYKGFDPETLIASNAFVVPAVGVGSLTIGAAFTAVG